MEKYVLNDPARVTIQIVNDDGALADPSALRFDYRTGGDTLVELVYGVDAELVRESTGVYHVDLPNDVEGRWKWHWESDGVEAADQGEYRVLRNNVEG